MMRLKEFTGLIEENRIKISILAISLLVSAFFLWELVSAWQIESSSAVTCSAGRERPNSENFDYIEIGTRSQHPIEPSFDGYVFLNLGNRHGKEAKTLKITRSGQRSYAAASVWVDLQYDEQNKTLWMRERKPFDFIAEKRSHRYFPFDSASFDFELTIDPSTDINFVRIINRAPGFVIDCSTIKIDYRSDTSKRVRFELWRSPLTQLTAVILCVAATIFLFLIVSLEKIDSLATSVASYFFSLWSIRAILSSEIKVFPTLLDCWILTLCAVMLFMLGWRILYKKLKMSQRARQ